MFATPFRRRRPRPRFAMLALAMLVLPLVAPLTARGAVAVGPTRVWVSGVGDDANPCSRTAPCLTLAGAFSKVQVGGTINAIDPASVGPLLVNAAVTIDLDPFNTGILTSGTTGLTIAAPSTADVVIRGLSIHGARLAGACNFLGVNGILVSSAHSVRIERSFLSGSAGAAVRVAPSAGATTVSLDDVSINDNCAAGVDLSPAAGATAKLLVDNTTISNSGTGLQVGAGGTAWLSDSAVFGNALGVATTGGGVLYQHTDSPVVGNTVDGAASSVLGSIRRGPSGPAGNAGPAGAAGPVGGEVPMLAIDMAAHAATARTRHRVTVRYVTTLASQVTMVVRRGSRVVETVQAASVAGRNTVAWDARLGRTFAPRGNYTLELRATTPDGQVATTTLHLGLVSA